VIVDISDLLLRKEELPIIIIGEHHPFFSIPIHPALLRADAGIDPALAHQVFRQAMREWYADQVHMLLL
jgi:hypothetical protein